jgi:hypothetical protein
MFCNFGTLPGTVEAMSDREKILCWEMAKKEMKGRRRK